MSNSKDKEVDVSPATSSSSVKFNFFDRSPSVSSIREDRWPELLISRPDKSYYYTTKCKYLSILNFNDCELKYPGSLPQSKRLTNYDPNYTY